MTATSAPSSTPKPATTAMPSLSASALADPRRDRALVIATARHLDLTWTRKSLVRPLRAREGSCCSCRATEGEWCDLYCPADDPWNPYHNENAERAGMKPRPRRR